MLNIVVMICVVASSRHGVIVGKWLQLAGLRELRFGRDNRPDTISSQQDLLFNGGSPTTAHPTANEGKQGQFPFRLELRIWLIGCPECVRGGGKQ